ncbi:MAG: hypothetical protein GY850_26620 [bacterium]|nr:hypothetical protein [bacterium]
MKNYNRVAGKIRDTELIDQFVQVDTLPEKYGHILKALLEAFIKKHRFEELAMSLLSVYGRIVRI